MVAALGLLALARAGEGPAVPVPPPPDRWVTDTVGFLSPAVREELDRELESYDHQSGHQVVVWIGSTTGDVPLDDWSVHTFEAWKVGRKGFDDGLAMFVLADDHAIDLEVGYGLEGQVPDATAGRIIHDVMAPRLQAGDNDGAVQAGVASVLTAIEGHPVDGVTGVGAAPGQPPPTATPQVSPVQLVLIGILVALFLVLLVTHPRLAMWLLWTVASGGRGGGFSNGGGGGGFSGGGGRSGGGGARGSW